MAKKDTSSTKNLTAAEICAVAGAFKKKAVDAAKETLKDGCKIAVNFSVIIVGFVSKGKSTLGVKIERQPDVSLTTFPTFCRVLRILGFGPKRVKDALIEAGDPNTHLPDDEMQQVFSEVEAELQKAMKPITEKTDGKQGSVSATVDIKRVA